MRNAIHRALALGVAAALLAQGPAARSQEASPQAAPDYKNPRLPVERRVADLLSRMTIEEKAAQTHAIWQQKALVVDEKGAFSPEKARAVLKDGIGQVTRPNERRGPRESAEFVNAIQRWVLENTRLGIPVMFHEEGLHGQQSPGGTNFPVPIALASSWDPALMHDVFSAVALEIRARGSQQVLAPVLDLARDPRWGRTEETYGEDPYLVSRLGVAVITAYQGGAGPVIDGDHVMATAKHFAVHGQPEGGVNVAPANYSMRVVREYWLEPFRAAFLEAGAGAVMASYNEVDGVPSHANTWLLGDVLRGEWAFDGMVVSDYNGIRELESLHHVAADARDAARQALAAGVDLELPDIDTYKDLAQQVREGLISEATLDRTVSRILRAKFLTGLFESPYADPERAARVTNSPEHQRIAEQAARESMILLKNQNNLLPLDRSKLKSIAVIGPNAADLHLGGYSDVPGRGVTILDGIKAKVGAGVKVNYAVGVKITESEPVWTADKVVPGDPALNAKRILEAVAAAKASDVALVVVGDNEQTSREAWATTHLGDRDDLSLFGQQNDLVRAVVATGRPTVVLLINGRPPSIPYIAENVPAILEGWYLGQEQGTAVADVLFGDFNPAGKLPVTLPRSVGQLPAYYSVKPSARRGYLLSDNTPLFPFGHGLSYTTFKYGAPRVADLRIAPAGSTTVSVDVTNTGSRAGAEVVQLYIRDRVSSVTRPIKELKGFERVMLNPGETKTVTFRVKPESLAFYNREMKRVVEPGMFDLMVGGSSAQLQTAPLEVVAR